jgi:hypothetical protein
MSAGFALMALSPDTSASGVKIPNMFLLVLLLLAVAVGSFFAGRKAAPKEQAADWRAISGKPADRPVCPPGRQIWSSGNKAITLRSAHIAMK